MKQTNYGEVVAAYETYKNNLEIAEWKLGHEPVLKKLEPVIGKTILDFGCGPATFSSILSQKRAHVVGYDLDPKVIARAREVDPRGDYRVYRGLLQREFNPLWAQAIVATLSFCLIPDHELRYILRDMRDILQKSGGRLFILEPNQEKAHGIQYANLHYHFKEGVKSGDHVHVTLGSGENAIELYDDIYRTREDYVALLQEARFFIEKIEEPRPDPLWEGDWEMELQYPPFLLITAY